MIPPRICLAGIAALILLRGVMAALLPLSADEAYYWLWSKHLALGYFDHPPMIAWAIGFGTLLAGDTPLGVRLAGVLLSIPASWFVWQSARMILKDASPASEAASGGGARSSACDAKGGGGNETRAAMAALFFNLTLMVSVEMLAATPDMPSVVTAAAMLWCLAKVQASGDGKYWLAFGVAAGLGLLSKYSALFLGLATLIWLLVDARQRRWLLSPWPYLGAVLALVIFAPHLLWQSQHHWQTFAFQFGRVGGGGFTPKYLGEFLAAQLGLATPLIFVLMLLGLWRGTSSYFGRSGSRQRDGDDRLLLAVLVWTGAAYFLQHALHGRVQGNWPCFLYPALAILAADAVAAEGGARKISFAAAPLALLLVIAVYAQALFAPVKLNRDPLARILGRDFAKVGDVVGALSRAHLADAILTTDYETTAWLRWGQPGVKVIQVNEPARYTDAPAPSAQLWKGRLFYLANLRRDQHPLVQRSFGYMGFPTQFQVPGSLYMLYPVGRPKSSPIGKMP